MPNEVKDKVEKGGTPNDTEEKNKTEKNNEPEDKKEEGKEENKDTKSDDHLKQLKEENAKRRQENKALKEQLDRQNKALAILQGKEKPDLDPVEQAKASADAKLKNALLRAELASIARDAHDPALLFQVDPKVFKDIEVDLESETVDREALEEAVEKLKKSRPFLFKVESKDEGAPKKGAPLPKDGGQPANGKNHMAIWKQLKTQNRDAEAAEYYKKNRAEILAQMKSA